jgi:hypothetical protein
MVLLFIEETICIQKSQDWSRLDSGSICRRSSAAIRLRALAQIRRVNHSLQFSRIPERHWKYLPVDDRPSTSDRRSIVRRASRMLQCFHEFDDLPNLRSCSLNNIYLSFLALQVGQNEKVTALKQR